MLASASAFALLALAGAQLADAVIVPGETHAVSYEPISGSTVAVQRPFDFTFHNLDYNAGRVMPSNTNYAFYWDPPGAPTYPLDYQPGIDTFFEDLAHDSGGQENVDSVATQYNDRTGAHANYDSRFGGAIVDTDAYPASGCAEVTANCLTDAQLREELAKYLTAHRLPMDLVHEYFMLLPPGVETCFGATSAYCSVAAVKHERESFCAYHSSSESAGHLIIYADDPYAFGGRCDDGNHPNGSTSDATLEAGLSHEHNESTTDPVPNKTWTDWATGKEYGLENGDKCRTFVPETEFGTPLGEVEVSGVKYKYNQIINGHPYWFQQEWSNQGHRCMQRYQPTGALPTAAYTWTAGGEELVADASESTAEGGVSSYEWQLNEFEGQTPTTSCSEGSHGPVCVWRPTKGVKHVALTVFAADGASAGTAHWINVGHIAEPTLTSLSPVKGRVKGRTRVVITGTEFVAGEETVVMFGSVPAPHIAVNSLTQITATTPAHVAGTVDVTVTTMFGTTPLTAADRFKFGPPVITRVEPSVGPTAGGTIVTVTGEGFDTGPGATTFKVGASAATGVSCASTRSCELTTPSAKAVGTVDVIATVNGVKSVKTTLDHFTYG